MFSYSSSFLSLNRNLSDLKNRFLIKGFYTADITVGAGAAANVKASVATTGYTLLFATQAWSTVSDVLGQGCTFSFGGSEVTVAVKNIGSSTKTAKYYVYCLFIKNGQS